MEQKKYNEFTVVIQDGKIIEKMPTARKSVMIYEHEAERLNNSTIQTKIHYELAKKQLNENKADKATSNEILKTKEEIKK